jgi:RNA polymerase sigma-70 factor (ECF subfamily)
LAAGEADDLLLVRAAREGNRAAFGQLYLRYARLVHGILLSRVPPSEVEDLLQEVFAAALRKLSSLRDGNAFGAWLSSIARNRARDFYRDRPPVEPLTIDPPVQRTHDSEAMLVLDEIKRMPEAYRETLLLRLVEGMTGPEIAQRTGLTPESVRVNLCRGMKLLRERLANGRKEGGA